MKYLKTYKLFENNSDELNIDSDEDWNKLNENHSSIVIRYKIKNWPELPEYLTKLSVVYQDITHLPKLPESLIELYCQWNKLTEIPKLPENLEVLKCYENPLVKLPEGINRFLLECNDTLGYNQKWITNNAYKWIVNKPKDYELLKNYLSQIQLKKLENEHPEIISQNQFGMFGLKNNDKK